MMVNLGNQIAELLKSAQNDICIVAPFMRHKALAKLLEHIGDVKITIVTRWRPSDLLAGASDLDVYDLAHSRKIKLYLRNDLHAKFFAADENCLIGSANVTDTALGWRTPANFELLVPVLRSNNAVAEFEKRLLTGAEIATKEMRDCLARSIENLDKRFVEDFNYENTDNHKFLPPNWIPEIGNPEDMFAVYRNQGDVSHLPAIKKELARFSLVGGLSEEEFRNWIAAMIRQTPFVCRILALIEHRHEVQEVDIETLFQEIRIDASQHSTRDTLEVLNRWFNCFFPGQYETSQSTIKLRPVTK